jgi:TonB family protein
MNWLNYLLQVNLYLILFYGFYRLLLRTETFFNLNRGYLVASAALAFFIPLMQFEWIRSWFVTEQISQTITTLYDPQVFYVQASEQAHTLTLGDFMAVFYITGILLGIARFGGNLVYLGKLMKQKTVQKDSKQAFSFFNVLFVSKELKSRSTIMKHEFVHIRQLHSADVLLFELIAIFNWFNPVVYLYKSSIKHIHEFIADEVASRNEASKADYAMLLFQEQFGVQAIPLTNNFFNQSLLKLRIKMLYKERSTQTAMMKYGLIAPLFMLMIVVSSATLASKELAKIEEKVEQISDENLAEIIIMPSESVSETLLKDNIDLSEALIISPDLVDEVKAIQESKQDTIKSGKDESSQVFTAVEQTAEFVGGMKAFTKYLQENLKYPESSQKSNRGGKTYIMFTINTDGSSTDFQILKSTGDEELDNEALRVLKLAKWTPGMQSGRAVRSRYTVPINFELAKEQKIRMTKKGSDAVFDEVEQNPEFPGGMQEFGRYLHGNLKYPVAAQKANISGKVYTEFIVKKDGSVSDFKTLKGIGYGCDEEAMRVIKSVPKWNPGRHKGEVVSSKFVVPINFQLSE